MTAELGIDEYRELLDGVFNDDVVKYSDIAVKTNDIGSKTSSEYSRLTDRFFLTFRMIYRDLSFGPLLSLSFILIHHVGPEYLILVTGDNVLNELKLFGS